MSPTQGGAEAAGQHEERKHSTTAEKVWAQQNRVVVVDTWTASRLHLSFGRCLRVSNVGWTTVISVMGNICITYELVFLLCPFLNLPPQTRTDRTLR